MIECLPDVPPALLMLVSELAKSSSDVDARKRVRGMLYELREQSEVFIEESLEREGYVRDPLSFDVHLHGALDLLSAGGCEEMSCRIKAADQVARSVGLFADRVWITDHLSYQFLDFGRATNSKIEMILDDVAVLSRLLPLIFAGVVKFRSPWISTCSDCMGEFESRVMEAAKDLAKEFEDDFEIEHTEGDEYIIDTGDCFDPKLIYRAQFSAAPTAKEFAREAIYNELRSAFFVAREASFCGGSVFSNSRIGMAGLVRSEGRVLDRNALLKMDKQREFNIPWVSNLDSSQIVQLRQEASSALPAFREKMARMLSSRDVTGGDKYDLMDELREQAIEVRNELRINQSKSARYWKTAYGVLGLAVSAYGAASGDVAAGVGGLLPIIQLLLDHKSGHGADVSRQMYRPGYVLVKAQDILSHAE